MPAPRHWRRLQIENQAQTGGYPGQKPLRGLAGPFEQIVSIQRHKLSHIGHRVLGQAHHCARDQDVSGRVEQPHIRCKDQGDHRAQAAAVERVGLNDEDGPTKPGLRAAGVG